MSLATLLPLALKASLMLMVFALGLSATPREGTYLFRQPRQLLRVILAMNVIMPIAVVLAIRAFNLDPAVKLALFTLALAPIPPVLPHKALKAGGDSAYTIGLLVSSCLLCVPLVPLSFAIANALFGLSMPLAAGFQAKLVLVGVLLPLAAGMVIRSAIPTLAPQVSKYLSLLATAILMAALLPVLLSTSGRVLSLVGHGMLIAFAAFSVAGLMVGHWLGGTRLEHRSVLALATASRHPGIAVAIAHSAFPQQTLVAPAVIAYLLVEGLVCIPYVRWVNNQRDPSVAAPPPPPSRAPL